MSEEGGLEKKLKGYEQSVAIGQGVGLAATAGGVLNVDKLTRYVPGIENLLNKNYNAFGYNIAPGLPIIGAGLNFIGDQIGFAASLYASNSEKYRGVSGKINFVKDGFNLGIRHLGSYLITYPLAIAASTALAATGILTGAAATIAPYILESLITGFGYIASTLGYRRKMAQPSYAT